MNATTKIPDDDGQKLEEVVFDEKVQFCWVDVAGARVSPVHGSLSAALNFVTGWKEYRDRLERSAERAREKFEERKAQQAAYGREPSEHDVAMFEREVEKIQRAQQKLSRVGTEPYDLRRLVTRVTVEMPTTDELKMAKVMHEAEFGPQETIS